MMYTPAAPIIVPQIPANVDYAGQLDFDILITSHTANRNSWIVSNFKPVCGSFISNKFYYCMFLKIDIFLIYALLKHLEII